jgi:hypothetical protein
MRLNYLWLLAVVVAIAMLTAGIGVNLDNNRYSQRVLSTAQRASSPKRLVGLSLCGVQPGQIQESPESVAPNLHITRSTSNRIWSIETMGESFATVEFNGKPIFTSNDSVSSAGNSLTALGAVKIRSDYGVKYRLGTQELWIRRRFQIEEIFSVCLESTPKKGEAVR